jgi:aminoglycoside phosphotransferase (APT) family kinase protein
VTSEDDAARLHDEEVAVTSSLVRHLVASSFPQWADFPLTRVASTGTDNAIFRLGDQLGLRFPRVGWAENQIAKESEWLPRIALQLPVEVPEPLAVGEPGAGYPFPWLVFRWLEGDDMQHLEDVDFDQLARDIAAFVHALEAIDATGVPLGGRHGGRMWADDETVRSCIEALQDEIDANLALSVWEAALEAGPWRRPPVWVHGDLLPGNVIVRDGRVTGIIDWSSAGAGDPACELMIAWALPPAARALYRSLLELDEPAWARARGLVVEQAVNFITYYRTSIPAGVAAASQRLNALLSDQRH